MIRSVQRSFSRRSFVSRAGRTFLWSGRMFFCPVVRSQPGCTFLGPVECFSVRSYVSDPVECFSVRSFVSLASCSFSVRSFFGPVVRSRSGRFSVRSFVLGPVVFRSGRSFLGPVVRSWAGRSFLWPAFVLGPAFVSLAGCSFSVRRGITCAFLSGLPHSNLILRDGPASSIRPPA